LLFGCISFLLLPPGLFLLAGFLVGVGFGISTTGAGAIMADSLPPTRMGEGMGYYGTGISLSMAVGPLVGLRLADLGNYALLFILTGCVTLLAFALTAGLTSVLSKREISR